MYVILAEKRSFGLCEQTIPPIEFFLQNTTLEFNCGVVSLPGGSEVALSGSENQTMHNSNLFDSVACPEAATIIISILSVLMRPVSGILLLMR